MMPVDSREFGIHFKACSSNVKPIHCQKPVSDPWNCENPCWGNIISRDSGVDVDPSTKEIIPNTNMSRAEIKIWPFLQVRILLRNSKKLSLC
nr:hypothetical protein CFP56_49128 [Quercus suber]